MIGLTASGSVTAAQGGNSVTAGPASTYTPPTEDEVSFLRIGQEKTVRQMTASIVKPIYPIEMIAPKTFVRYGVVTAVESGKVAFDVSGRLDFFDSFGTGIYGSGTLHGWRATDGNIEYLGSQAATGVSLNNYGTAVQVDTNSAQEAFGGGSGVGYDLWYRVTAVDASGQLGTPSAWVSYTIEATTGSSATNSTDTTTLSETAGALAAPANFTVTTNGGDSGLADLAWDAVGSAVAYVVERSYYDPAQFDAFGDHIKVTGTPSFQVGDLVTFERLLDVWASDWVNARAADAQSVYALGSEFGDWTEKTHWDKLEWKEWGGSKPASAPEDWYLEVTVPDGESFALSNYWASHEDQDYYQQPFGETHRFQVWAEASSAFSFATNSGYPGESDGSMAVGTTGSVVSFDVNWPAERTGGVSQVTVSMTNSSGSPITIKLCGLRMFNVADPYAYEFYSDGVGSVSCFRDHTTIKPQFKHWRGEALKRELDWFWGLCLDAGVKPWNQITWLMPESEWIAVAEHIADNMSSFPDGMEQENGNERWNTLPAFITTVGMTDSSTAQVYTNHEVGALFDKAIYGWMRAGSASFAAVEDQIFKQFGGWNLQGAVNDAAAYTGGNVDAISIASYVDGPDAGASDLPRETIATFNNMGGVSSIVMQAGGADLLATAETLSTLFGKPIQATSYEMGPGLIVDWPSWTPTQREEIVAQECVMSSRGAATATLDMACRYAEVGGEANYFTFNWGRGFDSHSRGDYRRRLPWYVCKVLFEKTGEEFEAHPFLRAKGESEAYTDQFSREGDKGRVAITAFKSITHPGRWIFAVRNLYVDRSVFPGTDPNYEDGRTEAVEISIRSAMSGATSCEVLLAGVGNCREHTRFPAGYRRNDDLIDIAAFDVVDPLCVDVDHSWSSVAVPSDMSDIDVSSLIGEDLRGMNYALICFEGVTL